VVPDDDLGFVMSGPFPFHWVDLRYPKENGDEETFSAQLTQKSFAHFVEKHIRNEYEPWDQWLPPDLVREVRQTPQLTDLPEWVILEINRHCEMAAREALARPLLLEYRVYRPEEQGQRKMLEVYQLVLPAGALLILHKTKKGFRVRTCYFPVSARKTKAATRWKRVVSRVAPRHCVRVGDRHSAKLTPPGDDIALAFPRENRPNEQRFRIRFHNLEMWGFHLGEGKPPTWNGRFPDWPAATHSAQPSPPKSTRRLRARYIQDSEA
jgi:hypothetical protein